MKRPVLLGALVLVPRLLAFPLNEDLYGDAVGRTWLGHLWAQAPHVIASFAQGGRQFGPTHITLLGLLDLLFPGSYEAGRAASLVAGVLGAWPLWTLTRRLFGERAADWAVFVYALWGVHVQCSTTTASEAFNLTLVLAMAALVQVWVDTGSRPHLLGAALALTLACATRYDSWLLVPLVPVLLAAQTRRLVGPTLFGAAALAFPLPWMWGNAIDLGDPLYPLRFIDDFHRTWFVQEQTGWGGDRYFWICLLFWPGVAVVTLTPPVALAAFAGLGRAWRAARQSRWLVALVVLPAVLYTARSTLLHSFVPLARFTLKEVVLLLPFVFVGAEPLLAKLAEGARRGVVLVSALGLVAFTVGLGAWTWRRDGTWENTARPISPTSTNSAPVRALAAELRRLGQGTGGVVVIDVDPRGFDDLQVGYLSDFPFERLARRRAWYFESLLANGPWQWLVRFDGGQLDQEGHLDGAHFTWRGLTFEEVPVTAPPFHLYRRL